MTTRVPIRYGGTGANTAAEARTALGVAPAEAFDVANAASSTANAAYSQANAAYAQANSAYNAANNAKVTVYANNASNVTTQNVNFVNTATVTVTVTADGANANIEFTAAPQTVVNDTYTAAGNTAAAATANIANGLYAISTSAYDQANTARTTANDAYGVANTASSTANAAYSQANTAYGQANDAYSAANTANNNALAAYGQANAAYTQANAAYGQANLAYGQANAAYNQANSAYAEANLKLNLTGGSLSGSLNIVGDLSVTNGNIYLSGNTTFINVATYSVDDPLIYLAANNLINDSVDIGFVGSKNSGPTVTHTGLARDASDGTWYLFDNLADSGHVGNVIDFANSSLAILRANINANSILLTGNAVATQANLTIAYNQANAAYSQANLAYSQANTAYGQANLAYSQANSAYGQANLAYSQANAAYGQANAAYGQANAAYTQANSAANTVRVSQNGSSTLSAKQLNFVNTTNVTITVTDSGNGNANIEFEVAAGGGGSALTIKEEGVTLNTAVTSIDFTGIVSATASGSNVTISVPAGLSNTIIKTTSYTSVNAAANLTYALPTTPSESWYIFVIKNGIVLTPNTDYSVSGNTLTVIESGAANDSIEVRYFDQLNLQEYPNTRIEIDSNTVASQTNTFYVTSNVATISRLSVAKNGLLLTPNLHFSVSGNTVTLNTVAEINDVLTFTHIRDLGPLEAINNGGASYAWFYS
jgi:hypothetical protein